MSTATLDHNLEAGSRSKADARTSLSRQTNLQVKSQPEFISRLRYFWRNFQLEHSFTIFGLLASLFIVALFTTDLVTGWPFRKFSAVADVLFVICGSCMFGSCVSLFYSQTRKFRIMLLQEQHSQSHSR